MVSLFLLGQVFLSLACLVVFCLLFQILEVFVVCMLDFMCLVGCLVASAMPIED